MNTKSADLPTLRKWLLETDFSPILEHARNKKRILSLLTALTYDEDPFVSDNAIKATGLAASIISESDPEYVRNYLLRLFWLVNDESGGIGWRAPELIGEILYNCPQYSQFFPMLISLLNLEEEDVKRFLPGTLWAIGRVAQVSREAMLPARQKIQSVYRCHKDGGIKEMSVWCLEIMDPEILEK